MCHRAGSGRARTYLDQRCCVGSQERFDAALLLTTEMPSDQLAAYVSTEPRIVLTDEYAPVDNLIAILFRSRG